MNATPSPADEASQAALVATAMRALRNQHDPARAASLLDRYLDRYPQGALVEEALALAIEAHVALGDAHAETYARRYLASYPGGRFSAAARAAVGRGLP